eukprot:630041-Lingulodinium_polyedra.AAC.1
MPVARRRCRGPGEKRASTTLEALAEWQKAQDRKKEMETLVADVMADDALLIKVRAVVSKHKVQLLHASKKLEGRVRRNIDKVAGLPEYRKEACLTRLSGFHASWAANIETPEQKTWLLCWCLRINEEFKLPKKEMLPEEVHQMCEERYRLQPVKLAQACDEREAGWIDWECAVGDFYFVIPEGATDDTRITLLGSRSMGSTAELDDEMQITMGGIGESIQIQKNYDFENGYFLWPATGSTRKCKTLWADLCLVSNS